MARQKERPGVMLYFDAIRPAIKRMDAAQCGELLRALLDYAQYGEVPELDPMTGLAFDMLAPKIDRDAEHYEESREQRQYAVYARERKRNGVPVLSFADWRLTRAESPDNENIGPISPDQKSIDPYPSISATASITASPSASASTSPSAPASPSASPSAFSERERGESKGEASAVYAAWLRAIEAKDNERALNLSNRLFALGYHTDLATKELRRRPSPPGYS